MDAWDWFIEILKYCLLVLAVLGAAILVFVILVGFYRGVKQVLKPQPKVVPKSEFLKAAQRASQTTGVRLSDPDAAFVDGAVWAWERIDHTV